MFSIVLQLVFESITFSFSDDALNEKKIYFKANADIMSPFDSQLTQDKPAAKILSIKVLSKIFRHKTHCKPEPNKLKELFQRKFKPKALLEKSTDPLAQFDNLNKVIKVASKIQKRIQLLLDKDKRYRSHQPQYITHNARKTEDWLMQVKRLTPVPLEESDLETKISIEEDDIFSPKSNMTNTTCFRIPLSLKVNGKKLQEMDFIKLPTPQTPLGDTARSAKHMLIDTANHSSIKARQETQPLINSTQEDQGSRRKSVFEKVQNDQGYINPLDQYEQEVINIISQQNEGSKQNKLMVKNKMLRQIDQFNIKYMLKPQSPLSKLSVYNCNSCTAKQCNQQHCHNQIKHQINLQFKPNEVQESKKPQKIKDQSINDQLQTIVPITSTFIGRISLQQDSIGLQNLINEPDVNIRQRRGSQIVNIVNCMIDQTGSSLEKKRSSLYDYTPLDLDTFTDNFIDNVFDQNVQTNEVSIAVDSSASKVRQISQLEVQNTEQSEEKLEILHRPKHTFLNKHAQFNRRNLLAVNRFNKIQIQENNRHISEQRKRNGLEGYHKSPQRIAVDSTEKFILVTGTQTPKDFFANKKSTFSQPRKTLQVTKHDYLLFSEANSPSGTPLDGRLLTSDFRFRRKSGLGSIFSPRSAISPKSVMSNQPIEGVHGQQISQLVNYFQKLAEENKDLITAKKVDTNSIPLEKIQSSRHARKESNQTEQEKVLMTPKIEQREVTTIKTPIFTKRDEEIDVITIRAESQIENLNTNQYTYQGKNRSILGKNNNSALQNQLAKRSRFGTKKQQAKQPDNKHGSVQSINKDLEIGDRVHGLGGWKGHDSMESSQFGSERHGKSVKAVSQISGLDSKRSPRDEIKNRREPNLPVRQINRTVHIRQQTPINIISFQAQKGFNLEGIERFLQPISNRQDRRNNQPKSTTHTDWQDKRQKEVVFSQQQVPQSLINAYQTRQINLAERQKTPRTPQYRLNIQEAEVKKDLTTVPFILKTYKPE